MSYLEKTGIILIVGLVLLVFWRIIWFMPISFETVTETLVTSKFEDDYDLGVNHIVEEGNYTKLEFTIKEGSEQVKKIIRYSDDIEYVASNENTITYKVRKNIFGNEMTYDDVEVSYDSNLFDRETFVRKR